MTYLLMSYTMGWLTSKDTKSKIPKSSFWLFCVILQISWLINHTFYKKLQNSIKNPLSHRIWQNLNTIYDGTIKFLGTQNKLWVPRRRHKKCDTKTHYSWLLRGRVNKQGQNNIPHPPIHRIWHISLCLIRWGD